MADSISGALMVCGTASGAGKSLVVTGLCRLLARRGVRVAPFKAQNMSNNSAVASDGGEIGRAQWAQARAAGVEPETAMNPVLLKPAGETTSHVVVMGRAAGTTDARQWGDRAPDLLPLAASALDGLRHRFDVVVAEGAGSPAEINLLDRDIANLRLAAEAGIPAVLVGDVDRGGVFAALYGTVELLPPDLRRRVRALVVNKFRGDPTVLEPGLRQIEDRLGLPVLGVLPWVDGVAGDEEDSLDLGVGATPGAGGTLDVAVVRFPRVANFTDVEPLAHEPDVAVRFVDGPGALGAPDLVVLPGTRSTVLDLEWLRASGLADAVAASGAAVLGLCGGYQMMGRTVDDPVESGRGRVPGLGWLDVVTRFHEEKVVRRRAGRMGAHPVEGYEIRHGRPEGGSGWIALDDGHGAEAEGAASPDGRLRGTSLHGLFEADAARHAFLADVAARRGRPFRPGPTPFAQVRAARFDRLADLLEEHLDVDALLALAKEAG